MYAEDLDLNYKVKAAGFYNYYVGDTAIIHHGGRSSSRQKVSQWATIMKYGRWSNCFERRAAALTPWLPICNGRGCSWKVTISQCDCLFGRRFWDRESLRFSLTKWKAVLKWAIGWQRRWLAMQKMSRSNNRVWDLRQSLISIVEVRVGIVAEVDG